MRRFFLVLALCFLWINNAGATSYYIDADAGSDGNPGTIGSPWQTGIKWDVVPVPGDTIYYKRGTTNHYGPIIYTWSGSAGSLITFSTYSTGSQPIILPAGQIISGWTGPNNGVYSKSITLNVHGFLENYHSLALASDSTCASPSGGSYFNDTTNHILYYKPTGGTPGAVWVEAGANATGAYTAYPVGSAGVGSYITYDGLQFIGMPFYYTAGGANHVTFQNCTFSDSYDYVAALTFYSDAAALVHHITIDHCVFSYNSNNIYFARLLSAAAYYDSLTVSNNLISHTGESRYNGYFKDIFGAGWDNDGISCQNVQNSVFEHNEVAYGSCSRSAGINLWYDSTGPGTGVIVRYNYIHDLAHGEGIHLGGGDNNTANAQIYGNIIANCAALGVDPDYAVAAGITLWRPQTTGTRTNIYNNTIVNCPSGILMSNPADYFNVKNNLIINSSTYAVYQGSTNANVSIDYNGYYPTAGNVFTYNGGAVSYSTWKTHYDSNSVSVNPNITSSSDFRLQAGSPAINAGTNVGLTTDFAGNPVTNPPSIGAYSFGWLIMPWRIQ